ncbi:MAG: hypothetical protein RL240_1169 [Planctomycetota bacterium]|jgi:hypothetical protein
MDGKEIAQKPVTASFFNSFLCDLNFAPTSSTVIAPKRQQNSYDHGLRELVFQSGRTKTARQIGVPRSTIHGWTKARPRPVVTLTADGDYVESLEQRVYLLERRTARLRALLRRCVVLLRLSGFSLNYQRLPQGSDKEKVLRVIDHASRFVRLPRLLPALDSLLHATTIGRTRKNVDSMMPRLLPGLCRSKKLRQNAPKCDR